MNVIKALPDYSSAAKWMSAVSTYCVSLFRKNYLPKNGLSNKQVIDKYIGQTGRSFNCWGATLLYFNIIETPMWINQGRMSREIETNFSRLKSKKKLRLNDMAAFYDKNGDLVHTAVLVGDNKWFHKRGSNVCAIDEMVSIMVVYNEAESVRFYRCKYETKKE
jgi:hypothetical protein